MELNEQRMQSFMYAIGTATDSVRKKNLRLSKMTNAEIVAAWARMAVNGGAMAEPGNAKGGLAFVLDMFMTALQEQCEKSGLEMTDLPGVLRIIQGRT